MLQAPYFEDTLDFRIAHQDSPLALHIAGRGWLEGLYIAGARYTGNEHDPYLGTPNMADVEHTRELEAIIPEHVHVGRTRSITLQVQQRLPCCWCLYCCGRPPCTCADACHGRSSDTVR
jgi:hypothetical protein